MLYIIATPIGNLEDITLRALATLKICDYILCEDTRHSLKLLSHYDIHKPLVSYHQFNEKERLERIVSDLEEGKTIGLISDAGTPLISDPGFMLVAECQQRGLAVTTLPGASSPIVGLSLSGFSPTPFQFVGFLPKKKSELVEVLEELLEYPGTTIAFETAERIQATLSALCELEPTRKVAIARELTKRFETVHIGTPEALKSGDYKGEIVLLIEGAPQHNSPAFSKEFLQSSVEDLSKTLSTKDAITQISRLLRVPKKVVYAAVHKG
jgi:16S rRNA (cytidine1402-2'-O)-methyltransferase